MKLYTLYVSRTKSGKRTRLMTDNFKKCKAYMEARLATKHSKASKQFYTIEESTSGDKTYKIKPANGKAGYIGKNGFNCHT